MLNPSLKDLDLSSEELKVIVKLLARKRGIKAIKTCQKILKAIKYSYFIKTSKKSEKSKTNFSKARIEKIKK